MESLLWAEIGLKRLSQQITIPAGNTRAFLSFWLHIDTDETSTTKAFDTLDVQIIDSAGQATTLETFSNLDASAYHKRTFDLSDFIGQTVTVALTGKEDAAKQTSFIVDDFALVVQ